MKRLRALFRETEGVAAVEFALIAPVMFMMFAAIFEYGRVLFVEQAVRNIIDDVARTGVITALGAGDIETQVEDRITAIPGIEEFGVTVSDGAAVTIEVNGVFDLRLSNFLPSDSTSFTMTTQFPR